MYYAYEKDIIKLQNLLQSQTNIYNNEIFKRQCKLTFKDVTYYLIKLINNPKNSSITVTSELNIDNITNAKHDAFKKKRKLINPDYFQKLSQTLLANFYSNYNTQLFNKYRILAVDGTHVPLSKNVFNDGYKLTKNKTYVNALISGLYDVSNNVIVDLFINNSNSERKLYANQYDLFKKNDIVIHDRGYFSYIILHNLFKLNVYSIFRMKKSNS